MQPNAPHSSSGASTVDSNVLTTPDRKIINIPNSRLEGRTIAEESRLQLFPSRHIYTHLNAFLEFSLDFRQHSRKGNVYTICGEYRRSAWGRTVTARGNCGRDPHWDFVPWLGIEIIVLVQLLQIRWSVKDTAIGGNVYSLHSEHPWNYLP
jgi:hypothetical protein